jgi:hypothetical protein
VYPRLLLQWACTSTLAGEFNRLARVEAERISVTQTPVFLGSVQGGLTFPVLKRGDNYAAAFPARVVQQMSGSFAEFTAHGFPAEVVDQWAADFPKGLKRAAAQGGQRVRRSR